MKAFFKGFIAIIIIGIVTVFGMAFYANYNYNVERELGNRANYHYELSLRDGLNLEYHGPEQVEIIEASIQDAVYDIEGLITSLR